MAFPPPEGTIPLTPVRRAMFLATVVANQPLCREHFRLVLSLPSFPATEPGQFIQVSCHGVETDDAPDVEFDWDPNQPPGFNGGELLGPFAVLRRPFSLAGRRDRSDGVELDLIHRVVGIGTDWLSRLQLGDRVDILGPLGNRFSLPNDDSTQAILVGGGVGIPPMLYLAEKLANRNAVAFCGALSRDLLPLSVAAGGVNPGVDSFEPSLAITDFARHGVASVISTDDGSWGFRGFVTQALERYLDSTTIRSGPPPVLFTCGPEPMMKRVAQIAADRNIECQIAVERAMACGMGTCQSCCIKLKRDDARDGRAFAGRDWIYKLACTDGPVFKGADLLW
jgi:dihydroorotate dehydrogenase electron transfer subunit